jgi:hypothetical protein
MLLAAQDDFAAVGYGFLTRVSSRSRLAPLGEIASVFSGLQFLLLGRGLPPNLGIG